MKKLPLLCALATAVLSPGLSAQIISAGGEHACAIDGNRQVWCWGGDGAGQLGNGVLAINRPSPTPVDITATPGLRFTAVAAASLHTCALDLEGQAWCWGSDSRGQLGDDATNNSKEVPTRVDAPAQTTGFTQISAGGSHVCAIASGPMGGAYCWGSDSAGELGNDATLEDATLARKVADVLPPGRMFTLVATGSSHSCALDDAGEAWCWGQNGIGQLGNGSIVDAATPTAVSMPAGTSFVALAAGNGHSCALDAAGEAWCWGAGSKGQLGTGGVGDSPIPLRVERGNVVDPRPLIAIAAGALETCAIDSGGKAFCWGYDADGALGNDATRLGQLLPAPLDDTSLIGPITSVSVGNSFACASNSEGSTACWGNGSKGQIGSGHAPQWVFPQSIPELLPTSLSSGYNHTCGLDAAGVAWCWGRDTQGQLGNNSALEDQATPVPVSVPSGVTFVALDAGLNHTCALDTNKAAWCWGQGDHGKLGTGLLSSSPLPTQVVMPPGIGFTRLSAGSQNTCALDVTGNAWCWGADRFGALGDDLPFADSAVPVSVAASSPKFFSISVGEEAVCGIESVQRSLLCWGLGSAGQLGRGADVSNHPAPSMVVMPPFQNLGFSTIEAGGSHACAAKTIVGDSSKSDLYCWGWNVTGKVGNNSNDATVPLPTLIGQVDGSNTATVGRLSIGLFHTCARMPASDGLMGPMKCWGSNVAGQLADGSFTSRNAPTLADAAFDEVRAIASGGEHTCAITKNGTVACVGSSSNGQIGNGVISNPPTPVVIEGFLSFTGKLLRDGFEGAP